jgi:hypothetical protein
VPWSRLVPKKSALAASGCIKISLALTWIPLKKIKNKKIKI